MPSPNEIDHQHRRMEAHRATLAHYLDQVSILGSAYTPPGVGAGIREARAGIAQCKAALHGWGVAVDDHPDDTAELGTVVPDVPADAWLAPMPDVAPPPVPLTPAAIERLWRKALSARLQRRWAQAEPLFIAIAAADPGFRDVQPRLAETRRQLSLQALYADLRALRDADDWQAVLGGLADLESRLPGAPDPDGLRVWAEARQRREERYDAALAAADGGDWAAAVVALDALLAEAPGDTDAAELLGHARVEREAQRQAEARQAQAQAQERRRRRVLLTGVVDLVKACRYDDALAQIAGAAAQPDAPGDAALVAARLAETEAVPFTERLRAAELAGTLGDPRFPVAAEQWRAEMTRRNTDFGRPAGYWCYVRAGAYRIGGWASNEPSATIQIPAFWIARYPITVAQYAPFVAEGYDNDAERWWTPEGRAWRQKSQRTQPWDWDRPEYHRPNQPVIGVTWYEVTAFCAWLTEQMTNVLPTGYVLRLPTEAEWEAAAAYDGSGQRRLYPWGDADPTPDLAIYDSGGQKKLSSVGCCPAGASACGALDLAGNVWELTASEYRAYPDGSHRPQKDFTNGRTAWRGGSWYLDSSYVRCGARVRYDLYCGSYSNGFRVVLAP
ncbi:MAG: SUMF1/EgtB/PvdO family nonheme iron enzyme, partial [Chloroflexales bacterium]